MGETSRTDDGGTLEAGRTEDVPARIAAVDRREMAPEVALPLGDVESRAALALDPAFVKNEQMKEATERLHPVLQEALAHPLATSALSTLTLSEREFTRQAELLGCIDELNSLVSAFMNFVENSKRLGPREAKRLMEYLTIHASLLYEGGMLKRISTAFTVLAKTKLREIAKRPSREPFDEAEFEREQMIQGYIVDFLGGINTQRG